MRSRKAKILFLGVLLVAMAAVVVTPWRFFDDGDLLAAIEDLDGQWVDRPAPEFELRDRQGNVHRLSDYRGQVVFLNFWASFCAPCREEMPSMERLVRNYQDRDMVMVAVSLDEGWEEIDRFMESFLPGQRSAMTVLLDEGDETAHRFGTEFLPETYIIDRNGRIVARFVGDYDWGKPVVNQIIEGLM